MIYLIIIQFQNEQLAKLTCSAIDKIPNNIWTMLKAFIDFFGNKSIVSKHNMWFALACLFCGDDIAIDERIFVCLRSAEINTCRVDESSGIPADTSEKNLFSIDWTRFGDVTIDKWSPGKTDWVLLQ